MPHRRIDFVGRLDGRTVLGDGSVRFDARLTRTGVFDYGDHKELRTADEVFKKEALDSFKGLTVTIGHRAWLDSKNWRDFSVGHVGDDVRANADGIHVDASVIVKDADAIKRIDAKDLVEVSMGYSVELEAAPGQTPEGEKYDSIQRGILGNHAALGPANWGRAGRSVKLLDGAAYAHDNMPTEQRIDAPSAQNEDQVRKDLDAARTDNDAIRKERDTARTDAAAEKKRADALEAERDAARAEATKEKARADKAESSVDTHVNERLELLDGARSILGADYDAKGKSARDIRVAAIAKCDPAAKFDGKSDDYVSARFDLAVEDVKKGRTALGSMNEVTKAPAGTETKKSKLDEAHEKADAERIEASKAGPPACAGVVRK